MGLKFLKPEMQLGYRPSAGHFNNPDISLPPEIISKAVSSSSRDPVPMFLKWSLAQAALLVLSIAACSAPSQIAFRSPLLEAPTEQLTPEAKPTPIPESTEQSSSPPEVMASAQCDNAGLDTNAVAAAETKEGKAVVSTARRLVGRRVVVLGGRRFPNDCTGLVQAVFSQHGINISGDATTMYRYAMRNGTIHKGQPLPGDLVFFKETYDRNRDGRKNDGLTHVGIVENVESDGTVSVIHRVPRGVVRYHMNTTHPHARQGSDGQVINDWLRAGRKPGLTGELFSAYGRIIP